jgi:hypothetical protein
VTELDVEVFADFQIIMGDLNYRMDGTYESNIAKISQLSELIDEQD